MLIKNSKSELSVKTLKKYRANKYEQIGNLPQIQNQKILHNEQVKLNKIAIIRELHVYGQSLKLGETAYRFRKMVDGRSRENCSKK